MLPKNRIPTHPYGYHLSHCDDFASKEDRYHVSHCDDFASESAECDNVIRGTDRPDLPKQLTVAAEDVIRRVIHKTCRHRIEVDVDDEATERLRGLHELGLVPALPSRPARAVAAVVSLTEPGLDVPQRSRQWNWAGPKGQVVVVGHQGPGIDPQIVPIPGLAQDLDELDGLFRFREQIRPAREPVVDKG